MQPPSNPGATPAEPGNPVDAKRFERPRAVLSIRWIVAIAAAGLTAIAVFIVGAVGEHNARLALTREVETQLLLQARNLALASADALLADFPELVLHPLTKDMKSKQPELARALVVDHRGVIQGDPDARLLGTRYVADPKRRPAESRAKLGPGEAMYAEGGVMLASAPVRHRNGQQIGTAWVGLRRDYLESALAQARQQQMVVLGLVLAFGVIAALLLMSFVLRPVAALRAGIERIGRGDLATPLRLDDRTELGLLGDLMDEMAAELARMQVEMVERERLAHEVELAREIQASLLPHRKLAAGSFVIQGSHWAAAEVGGDYYDYFALPDGKVGIAVADVAGKGLAGCLVMSMLSALLRAYRNTHLSPAKMLAVLDERLGETLKRGSFVTMFYGVLDPVEGELVYASAGHSPLLIYRREPRTVEWHPTKGIPLGAIRGGAIARTLKDTKVTLGHGDLLVQFTDGINEAFDPQQTEQYGFERMERAVATAATSGCEAVIASLHDGVQSWANNGPRSDDETILVVSREGVATVERPALAASPGESLAEQGLRAVAPILSAALASRGVGDAAGGSGPLVAAAVPATGTAGAEGPNGRPLEHLAEARSRGARIALPPSLEALFRIRDWLDEIYPRGTLGQGQFELLSTALYEACANVVEHGNVASPGQSFDLWWVPGALDEDPAGSSPRERTPLENGYFLIHDRGLPFRADWKPSDFNDPAVWRRGRGFGLDIIHRVMSHVEYHPGTVEGNITLLAFVPAETASKANPNA